MVAGPSSLPVSVRGNSSSSKGSESELPLRCERQATGYVGRGDVKALVHGNEREHRGSTSQRGVLAASFDHFEKIVVIDINDASEAAGFFCESAAATVRAERAGALLAETREGKAGGAFPRPSRVNVRRVGVKRLAQAMGDPV